MASLFFPYFIGSSALMLIAARLRHIFSTKWGAKRYLSMDELYRWMSYTSKRLTSNRVPETIAKICAKDC